MTEGIGSALSQFGTLSDREAALVRAARSEALGEAAASLEKVKRADILLAAGEMTAQELRTTRAVLGWRARLLRKASEAPGKPQDDASAAIGAARQIISGSLPELARQLIAWRTACGEPEADLQRLSEALVSAAPRDPMRLSERLVCDAALASCASGNRHGALLAEIESIRSDYADRAAESYSGFIEPSEADLAGEKGKREAFEEAARDLERIITQGAQTTAGQGKPTLRFALARGETHEQMREDVRASDLYQFGDAKLVWANEGDLWNLMFQGVEVKDMSND